MNLNTYRHVVSWTARILGLLYFAIIALFFIAHAASPDGLPEVWREPVTVQLGFLALFLMAFGGIVGWVSEGVAAAMILMGSTVWLLVERHLPWPPGLMPVVGILYAITWWTAKPRFTLQVRAMQ
jgi:hypothetical protein